MAIADQHPALSGRQFIDVLAKDQKLPPDIRRAIGRAFLPSSRSVAASPAGLSADQRKDARPKRRRLKPSDPALDILFSVVQDTNAPLDQRRKAAADAAEQFLPKKHGPKRWWENAVSDEYGFAITPEIAAEYRDIKFELTRLGRSGADSPATVRRMAQIKERMKACHRQWETDPVGNSNLTHPVMVVPPRGRGRCSRRRRGWSWAF